MSESVKIGGIGKNPVIDKINNVNATDVKNFAQKKMEQLLLTEGSAQSEIYTRQVPIDFSRANWEGKT